MTEKRKMISIAEFRRFGYLQELNRTFLHPLGLALQIVVDKKTGVEVLDGVWDGRADPEGIEYSELEGPDIDKSARVTKEMEKRLEYRRKQLGYGVQRVPSRPRPTLTPSNPDLSKGNK